MGTVKGNVTYNGKKVTAGNLTFFPDVPEEQVEAGKPAVATIQPDGSYQLSTYSKNDGALPGTYRVAYAPPSPEAAEGEADLQKIAEQARQYGALGVPTTFRVTIKPGVNQINIKLVQVGGNENFEHESDD